MLSTKYFKTHLKFVKFLKFSSFYKSKTSSIQHFKLFIRCISRYDLFSEKTFMAEIWKTKFYTFKCTHKKKKHIEKSLSCVEWSTANHCFSLLIFRKYIFGCAIHSITDTNISCTRCESIGWSLKQNCMHLLKHCDGITWKCKIKNLFSTF